MVQGPRAIAPQSHKTAPLVAEVLPLPLLDTTLSPFVVQITQVELSVSLDFIALGEE
jgi:hypothetical protein